AGALAYRTGIAALRSGRLVQIQHRTGHRPARHRPGRRRVERSGVQGLAARLQDLSERAFHQHYGGTQGRHARRAARHAHAAWREPADRHSFSPQPRRQDHLRHAYGGRLFRYGDAGSHRLRRQRFSQCGGPWRRHLAGTGRHSRQRWQPEGASMSLRSDDRRWGSVAKFFHWIVALGILGNGVWGLLMTGMAPSMSKINIYALHKSIGLTVLALFALRLAWRLYDRAPPDVPMPPWQRVIAHTTHVVLYGFILAMPLSGWLFNSLHGYLLQWFKLFNLPALAARNDDLSELAGEVHEW